MDLPPLLEKHIGPPALMLMDHTPSQWQRINIINIMGGGMWKGHWI